MEGRARDTPRISNIEGSCRSWNKIVEVRIMEARAKRQSIVILIVLVVLIVSVVSVVSVISVVSVVSVVLVVSVTKMVDCVTPVKLLLLEKIPLMVNCQL